LDTDGHGDFEPHANIYGHLNRDVYGNDIPNPNAHFNTVASG
jgi:hypothetical protein